MRLVLLLLPVLCQYYLLAQSPSATQYSSGYFQNPLDIPASLAGNFGELRPNHYHMGLDFKTNHAENLLVHASADGYISRIKIEPYGFGRAIYINHPNGYTTLYAHLNEFYPALEQYVKSQQYKQESWSIYLEIPLGLFPVKKGDVIANSGNTGGSQGPHLHFEIRNTFSDVNLNPMLFGSRIPDNVAPTIQRLAIYDRGKSTYEQSPKIVPVKKSAAGYTAAPAVISVPAARVSFAVTSYDTQSGSSNLNGIYEGILYDNNVEQVRFVMNNISYETTRYINAHIDYKTKANGGPYLQHLSDLPGYTNSIYSQGKGNGIVDLTDKQVHNIRIETKDAYGNTATLRFAVKYAGAESKSAVVGKMFYPLMLTVGDGSTDGDFYIGEKGLYDSVHIQYKRTVSPNPAVVSAIHSIGEAYIPVQEALVVRIKPTTALPDDKRRRVVMQRFAGAKKEVSKVEWQQGGWAMARFREFGSFQLVLDETPPEIIPVGFKDSADLSKASRIVFTAKDNFNQWKNFRAELDGKWIRFTNDKAKNFIYIFDEQCVPGTHNLKVSIADEAGNITVRIFTFKR